LTTAAFFAALGAALWYAGARSEGAAALAAALLVGFRRST
jgi:hypothetical protein